MTRWATFALLAILQATSLAACASSPAAQEPAASPAAAAPPGVAPPSAAPGRAAPPPAATASTDVEHPDRSCKLDADCRVKDVGNCCGTFPMCVNANAAVDPKAVKAQCARDHRMGMCHVMAVGGCSCVQGQCADINAAQMPGRH